MCGRPLRDPTSIARRLGPVCARRLNGTTPAIRAPATDPQPIPGQTALDLQPMQPTLWSL
ncbi:DUF6011 domain-containing protein [Streptomyces sp. A012304]|uniref:DUF6011 domain-containing protein n=1 Tax=Streptomyces sp. A012304 TaxID=375446 RepID=UPI0035D3EAC8